MRSLQTFARLASRLSVRNYATGHIPLRKPAEVSYIQRIQDKINVSDVDGAVGIFKEMKEKGIDTSKEQYTVILNLIAGAPEARVMGDQLYQKLQKEGFQPGNTFVDMLKQMAKK